MEERESYIVSNYSALYRNKIYKIDDILETLFFRLSINVCDNTFDTDSRLTFFSFSFFPNIFNEFTRIIFQTQFEIENKNLNYF